LTIVLMPVIGDPDVEHLACTDRVVESANDLLDGREGVPDMKPVQVDVVGAEARERRSIRSTSPTASDS
jgi:hypothetical protein